MTSLSELHFDNSFVESQPSDPIAENYTRQVTGATYSPVTPTSVSNPKLIAWSDEIASLLGIARPQEDLSDTVQILSGNTVASSMKPFAMRYGGHQFGNWAGQLGDGRAINLGSLRGNDGKRYELQLKGAGPTPYSRHADGRAVLRSSIREFLCSEAMHHLGIPTTRALSLVTTGDLITRDMFYDGNPEQEPGAIVCRVAESFLRFGNFEILAEHGETENLKRLADYTIKNYFPELGQPSTDTYIRWFAEVCNRTADMIAHWMSVGFVHGVMNTDNMSVLGLTIDYGPYGWLEPYEPGWTPNTTDNGQKRYAYGRQPDIALWNLVRFAESLVPLVGETTGLETVLATYRGRLEETYFRLMGRKLGFQQNVTENHKKIIGILIECFEALRIDMTIFFRSLSHSLTQVQGKEIDTIALSNVQELLLGSSYDAAHSTTAKEKISSFLKDYFSLLSLEQVPFEAIQASMNQVNPKYVLRNYLAHQASVQATTGDTELLKKLMLVLTKPFEEHSEYNLLAQKRPDWAASTPGCSSLSCSS